VSLCGLQLFALGLADFRKEFLGARGLAQSLKRLRQLIGGGHIFRVEFESLLQLLSRPGDFAATQQRLPQQRARLRHLRVQLTGFLQGDDRFLLRLASPLNARTAQRLSEKPEDTRVLRAALGLSPQEGDGFGLPVHLDERQAKRYLRQWLFWRKLSGGPKFFRRFFELALH